MASLITSEVDFAAQGKHSGFLRLPHSVHRSAYGWIPVPVTCIAHGEGPTLLLMAGNHGDEYEGQIALSKLAQSLKASEIRGRVIILPMVNFPAAEAGLRTSPIDQGNLNRTFPGNPAGTPTEIMAHFIEEVLMPLADYAVDLHSGGSSLQYPATLLRGMGHSEHEKAELLKMQMAFDLPFAWVFTSGGGLKSNARTAMGAANRKGVINIMTELGGGNNITPDILAATERGLLRLLHAIDMMPTYKPDPMHGTRELHVQGSVYAYESGLFEPVRDIGDPVETGDVVGHIHHPETPWQDPDPVQTPYDGIVLAKRAMAQVKRGDALMQIARDAG